MSGKRPPRKRAETAKVETAEFVIGWEEMALAVLKGRQVTHGLWQVAVGLKFAASTAQWNEAEEARDEKSGQLMPTAMVGVAHVLLRSVEKAVGPMVIDASTGKFVDGTPNPSADEPKSRRPPLKRISRRAKASD